MREPVGSTPALSWMRRNAELFWECSVPALFTCTATLTPRGDLRRETSVFVTISDTLAGGIHRSHDTIATYRGMKLSWRITIYQEKHSTTFLQQSTKKNVKPLPKSPRLPALCMLSRKRFELNAVRFYQVCSVRH